MALCPGLSRWPGTRKVKPIWILLKQETAGGSGISWAICKSAPRPRQIPVPAPYHSIFTSCMPFLPPNQQCQSTEGINLHMKVSIISIAADAILRGCCLQLLDDDDRLSLCSGRNSTALSIASSAVSIQLWTPVCWTSHHASLPAVEHVVCYCTCWTK